MFFRLLHRFNDHIEVYYGERLLLRYVYVPRTPAAESPRPYLHPLRTLAGDTLTLHRPHDHRWQHGLSVAIPYLSGENFWGGPTYSREAGYAQQTNHGQQRHTDWAAMTCDDHAGVDLTERLMWITQAGTPWIAETRRLQVHGLDESAGHYALTFTLRLTNIHHAALAFGSPTTEGRPQAGYGGLHWRGARDLQDGALLLADGRTGSADLDLMGQAAPWLAYSGSHDGADRASTLLFLDTATNPRSPTQWFTRTEKAAAVSFALCYDTRYLLPPGDTLALTYTLVICTGQRTKAELDALAAQFGTPPGA